MPSGRQKLPNQVIATPYAIALLPIFLRMVMTSELFKNSLATKMLKLLGFTPMSSKKEAEESKALWMDFCKNYIKICQRFCLSRLSPEFSKGFQKER